MRLHCQVKRSDTPAHARAYFGQRGDGVAPASEAAARQGRRLKLGGLAGPGISSKWV